MSEGRVQKITTNLWFDTQAEEAAKLYTSIFKNSRIFGVKRYGKTHYEGEGISEGKVMTVDFELEGQRFVALNGGPHFKFSEAISFIVHCDGQEELDYYWDKLSEGGDEKAQACGWLKDKFGVSWQIVPSNLNELIGGGDAARTDRVMKALLATKAKIDLDSLMRAYEG
ncbi:VOC family protein [Cohnella sp. GCM10027633]|uniref:VOC family protein n=1 Tax=unclassified Cohnella TaxID=2636738 RepID=UPI003644DDDC